MLKLNVFARLVGISTVYASYLENGKRPAPSRKILDSIISVLRLSPEEADRLLLLAAETHHSPALSPDLIDYINNTEYVSTALRIAKDHDADERDWMDFIFRITKKKKVDSESIM